MKKQLSLYPVEAVEIVCLGPFRIDLVKEVFNFGHILTQLLCVIYITFLLEKQLLERIHVSEKEILLFHVLINTLVEIWYKYDEIFDFRYIDCVNVYFVDVMKKVVYFLSRFYNLLKFSAYFFSSCMLEIILLDKWPLAAVHSYREYKINSIL